MLRSEQWPTEIKRSHVRLLLPNGMDDSELAFALRNYQSGAAASASSTASPNPNPNHDPNHNPNPKP
eukprot:scaffold145292_cov112-Phaeocystis_antarctica.AAC.1